MLIDAIEAGAKKPMGVGHGVELVMVFGLDGLMLDASEHKLLRLTQNYWLNFCTHGDPNGAAAASTSSSGVDVAAPGAWPQFENERNSTLRLTTKNLVKVHLRRGSVI